MLNERILVDRSRIEAFQVCPRSRLLGYHFDGTGLARAGHALPLVGGIAYHSCLERILKGENMEVVLSEQLALYEADVHARGIYGVDDSALDFLIAEQSRLLEGLVRGWVQTRMDLFLEKYEIHAVEQEFEFELAPGLIQMMRLDVLARRRSDGIAFIPDFKGTGTAASYWRDSFLHNNQVNSYILAVQETLGERIGGMVIEGLIKGTRKEDTALSSPFHGKTIQYSPFCYGYENSSTGDVQCEYTQKKGFVKIASWEKYSTSEWLSIMGEETVRDQFLTIDIPKPEDRELKRWKRQVVKQELRISQGLKLLDVTIDPETREDILDEFFPMTRTACFRFNSPCAFQSICYDSIVEKDPIGSAFYVPRECHHTPEQEQMNA